MHRKASSLLNTLGVNFERTRTALRGIRPYMRNRREMLGAIRRRESEGKPIEFPLVKNYPCLHDRFESGGHAWGVYFHMDLWAAQRLFKNRPSEHVDVGSAVGGFCAHVASFMPIRVIDIRPTTSSARNLRFEVCDLMDIPDSYVGCTDSLSCLHTLEHFGLGRYGDPINYDGWRDGWNNLLRMLRPGGTFYFAVPIGRRQRIEFDAHRIFSLPFILDDMIADRLSVRAFAYIDDASEIHHDADPFGPEARNTFGLNLGCGVFELEKNPG
ncbi:MAG: DUF268 domain-containing protein [Planctomycetota bacterium]